MTLIASLPASAHLRRTMIDSQLRTVGINDVALLAAFDAVARESFVPVAMAGLAYADAAVEVAPGRWLLEPLTLGLLLLNARLTPADRVLVIGAATGYAAAVVAALGVHVTALESDVALIAAAKVPLVEGPLAAGWPGAAPYTVVLFEGAIEVVPPAIAAQLVPNGRAAAVVRRGNVASAHVGPVLADGRIGGLAFLEVAAHPLPGFAAPRAFAF